MKKVLLLIILVLLIITEIAVHFRSSLQKTVYAEDAFLLRVFSDGHEETVKPWRKDNEHICIFLPSYTKLEDVVVELCTTKKIIISGIRLSQGMTLRPFLFDQEYDLLVGPGSPLKLQFVPSAGVAAMFIQTESGGMDSVHTDKSKKESARIRLYTLDGIVDYQTKKADQIRGRGNSTWDYAKKPYNVYLGQSADLLHLGEAKHWVLLANAIDETNLRNWLVYNFADRIGQYNGFSPGCEFVDLFLNGEYRGLYLLCEKTEIAKNRLDVGKNTVLFNLDSERRMADLDNPFLLNQGSAVEIKSPDPCSPELQELLKTHLLEMQNAFQDNDQENLRRQMKVWSDYIDVDSWARKYLVEEIFQNYDAGFLSQYYFWNRADDKIYAGPCWDYDNILGLQGFWMSPQNFLAQRVWPDWETYTPWNAALWEKEEFREYVIRMYREEFLPELSSFLETEFSQKASQIKQAAETDRLRWSKFGKHQESYEEAVSVMLDYLSRRESFLNSAWLDGAEYCTVMIKLYPVHWRYLYYSVQPGTRFVDLPDTEKYGLKGVPYWLVEETGQPFDPETIITEDIVLYAEYQQ